MNIEAFYQNHLTDKIDRLNVVRKQIVRRLFLSILIAISVSILIFLYLPSFKYLILVVFIIASIIVISKKTKSEKHEFKLQFKEEVIRSLTNILDHPLTYSPEEGISQSVFQESKISKGKIDRYHSEDLFEGEIGETSFQFSEIKAEEKESNSDSQTTHVVLFNGLFFVANFNKKSFTKVIIVTDLFKESFGKLGNLIMKYAFVESDMQRIKLEDPTFEKNFNVYGEDQVEARYIMTPSLMERFNKLREKGYVVSASIIGNTLSIGIYLNKNLFEPKLYKSVTNLKEVKTFFEHLQFMTGLVEELNLNNRIYHTE